MYVGSVVCYNHAMAYKVLVNRRVSPRILKEVRYHGVDGALEQIKAIDADCCSQVSAIKDGEPRGGRVRRPRMDSANRRQRRIYGSMRWRAPKGGSRSVLRILASTQASFAREL